MTNDCGLQKIFGSLADGLPGDLSSEQDYTFCQNCLPTPPGCLGTGRVVLRKTLHHYNGWQRVDQLVMWVEDDVARLLAVFLLSCAFHRPRQAELVLLNPASEVRSIVYRTHDSHRDPPVGLLLIPLTFRYFPSKTRKHPWCEERSVRDLPLLALSTHDEMPITESDWGERNTVFLESSPAGTVRLAELLLNAGCRENEVREYELEGEAGFRGVAPMSAELRILLPGSDGWERRFLAAR